MKGFLDFLDTIPQRTRGAGGAIMGLARSVGRFAKQLAIATAVGDVLTNSAESFGLTTKQEKYEIIIIKPQVPLKHMLNMKKMKVRGVDF